MTLSTAIPKRNLLIKLNSWLGANQYLILFIVPIAALMSYANALSNPFIYDDLTYIIGKNFYFNFTNITKLFTSDYHPLTGESTYRPLSVLPFFFSYALFKLNPLGWRLFNLCFHIFNGLLIFYLVRTLSNKLTLSAFMAPLIFIVHPIFSETINVVGFNDDIQVVTFLLISLIIYTKVGTDRRSPLLPALSFLSFIAALFSKEVAVVLPLILLFYDVLYKREQNRRQVIVRQTPYWLASAIYLVGFFTIFKNPVMAQRAITIPINSLYSSILSVPKMLLSYLKFLFIPFRQSVMHQFSTWESIEPQTVILWVFFAVFIIYLIFLYRINQRNELFLLGFFLIFLLPVLNIIPIGSIPIAERYAYLPSIGIIIFVSIKMEKAFSFINEKTGFLIIPFAIIILLTSTLLFLTFQRNSIFASDITLWQDTANKYPKLALSYVNLGEAYYSTGFTDKSISAYNQAIEIEPNRAEPYVNLGSIYQDAGQNEIAEKYFLKATNLYPKLPDPFNNLGTIYYRQGDYEKSIPFFQKALKLDPYSPYFHLNLGRAYERIEKFDKATEQYKSALRLSPDFNDARMSFNRVIQLQKR